MGGFCSAVNEDMKLEAKRELQEVLARKSESHLQWNVYFASNSEKHSSCSHLCNRYFSSLKPTIMLRNVSATQETNVDINSQNFYF
jgi:hypothetical protein